MRLLAAKMRRSWTMTRYFGPQNFDDMIRRVREVDAKETEDAQAPEA